MSLEEGDHPSSVPMLPLKKYASSDSPGQLLSARSRLCKLKSQHQQQASSRIFDDPVVIAGYESVPQLEQFELPRGGISVDTAAYFNWFVRRKKCCLVVDSFEAEDNIRSVFEETLLGHKKFRDHDNPLANVDEDFDPDYPLDARPNFYKEFQHFRVAEKNQDNDELNSDMLLEFCHFEKGNGSSRQEQDQPRHRYSSSCAVSSTKESIRVPPLPPSSDGEGELTDEADNFTAMTQMQGMRSNRGA